VEELMRVLIAGAAGFAGRHVIEQILKRSEWEIVALDTNGAVHPDPRVTSIRHDLLTPIRHSTDDAIGIVHAVVNLAASSDVPAFLADPVWHAKNNVISTLHLLDWARNFELKSFIQVSTNEVYGPATTTSLSVEWDPLIPSTPYSASKAAQEMMAIGWRQTYGVPVAIVNTMHLYGEGQPAQRFVPTVIRKILAGENVPLVRSDLGPSIRKWTYAGDFGESIHWLLSREIGKDPIPDRWNVAGQELSCLHLTSIISRIITKTYNIEWVKSDRPGYDHRYALDTRKIMKQGWKPVYGTITGLARTIRWIEEEDKK
jgi:dTDP-glucose 4,6-dehydratase